MLPLSHALPPNNADALRFQELESDTSSRLVLCRASLAAVDFEGTVAGRLLEAADMPPAAAPNCLLAVLWASLANTVRCNIQVPLLGVRAPGGRVVGQLK